MQRSATIKGRKDLIDLVSLFQLSDFDWDRYKALVLQYNAEEYTRFTHNHLAQTQALEELELNVHKMARLKKRILSNF